MFYELLEYLFKNHKTTESTKVKNVEIETQQKNNERVSSGSSMKSSFKKVFKDILPSSRSQSAKSLSKFHTSSSTGSIKIDKNDFNNNLILSKNDSFMKDHFYDNNASSGCFENSQDNFEFKIPNEKFITFNDREHNNKLALISGEIVNDDDDEDDDDENSESVANAVGSATASMSNVFESNDNFYPENIKRNNSLKSSDDKNRSALLRAEVKSASSVLSCGSIKLQKSELKDLRSLNPPKKAQISSNLSNPSPPVSARSINHETNRLNNEVLQSYSPIPPPRQKQHQHSTHMNNPENIKYNSDNNKNLSTNAHRISDVEHFV